jgi:hypothetical protein
MRWTAAMAALKGLMVWCGEPKKRACAVLVSEEKFMIMAMDTNYVENQDFDEVHHWPDQSLADHG